MESNEKDGFEQGILVGDRPHVGTVGIIDYGMMSKALRTHTISMIEAMDVVRAHSSTCPLCDMGVPVKEVKRLVPLKKEVYTRISSSKARKLVQAGAEDIFMLPSNVGFDDLWVKPLEIITLSTDGPNYFYTAVNNYTKRNCNKTTGMYVKFYIKTMEGNIEW